MFLLSMSRVVKMKPQRAIFSIWTCFFILIFLKAASGTDAQRGPSFVYEPPSKAYFSNSSGTVVQCSAEGNPKPVITWVKRSGAPISDIPGIRQIRGDGSLVFFPFSENDYRQDVHAAVYKCVATNEVGSIASREVHVNGVLRQVYVPQVYDEFVIIGNAAVFRCHLPPFVRDHATVVSWHRDDGQSIGAADTKGGIYTLLQTGELYVHKVELTDSGRKFRCKTLDRLQGDLSLSSSSGQLIVTDAHGPEPPRINFIQSQIHATEGSTAQLTCAAQGQPPPEYRWYKEEYGQLVTLSEDQRIWFNNGVVTIRNVISSDAGKYYCFVSNSAGEEKAEITLTVSASLSVSVTPTFQVLDIGKQATFNCTVKGYPVHSLTWTKDLQRIIPNTRIKLLALDLLHITSVQREDKGMYQCFAFNEDDSAQGHAELSLGDSSPTLLGAFADRTLRPGDSLSLSCHVSGSPLPTVRWSIDDQRVSSNLRISVGDYTTSQGEVLSFLNISSVRVEDGGEYRCSAENEISSVSHSGVINVQGPPYAKPMKNVTVVSGKQLKLRCPVGGYPIEKITWIKGGIVLPLNDRQNVDASGVLTINDVQSEADKGEYTCYAMNAMEQSAHGRTYVSVIEAPVIDEHFFLSSISTEEKSRAVLLCSVKKGDPPLQIKWLKDNKPLVPHGDMAVQMSEDSSTISIRRVSARDHGQYTCVVSNSGASVNKTLQFIVNVPPRWTVAPKNTSAVLGKSVIINCVADGYPTPTITWRKSKGSLPGDFTIIYSNSRTQILNNGTLYIDHVEESDKGYYLCQAQNGIGARISKVVALNIHTPPRFDVKYKSLAVRKGEDATLECQLYGEQPIIVEWTKSREILDLTLRKRLSVQEKSEDDHVTSLLTIEATTRQDSGVYGCRAKNEYGSDESSIQVLVQEVPEPPVNITVTNTTSRTATLQWTPAFNGNSAIVHYILQYRPIDDHKNTRTGQQVVTGKDTTAVIRDLIPVTSYTGWVLAENVLGRSQKSASVNFTTQEEVPGGPPTDVKVQSTGSQSLKVSWKPPNKNLQYGKIKGYYVGYRTYLSQDQYQYKLVETTDDTENAVYSTYLTNLQRLTKYSVVVQAFNAAGPGPRTDEVLATTLETAPPTSPIVSVSSVTSSSIHLQWERDHKDKSVITEYVLHYRTEGDSWVKQRLKADHNEYVLEGLRCGTTYLFYITATNSLGTGEPSETITVRTKGAAPVSPAFENFVVVNSTSIKLKLTAWQSGGCPIQFFKISYRPKFQRAWHPVTDHAPLSQQVVHVGPLAPGREYNLLVMAHSEAGVTQAEYDFQTLSIPVPVSTTTPNFVRSTRNTSAIPFDKNLTLLIPIVISVVVILVVIFTVIFCLRRHLQDNNSGSNNDGQNRKQSMNEKYTMSDLSQKYMVTKDSSCALSSKLGDPVHLVTKPTCRKDHEYAEPYTAIVQSRCSSAAKCEERTPLAARAQRSISGGPFATIKRNPSFPGGRTSAACLQGEISGGHQVILPENSEYSSLSIHSEGSSEKGSSQSSGSRKPLQ